MPEVKIKQVPRIQVLYRSYTGPYDQAAKHFDELYQWIMRKGYAIAGGGIGLFYDDPTKVDPVSCRYEVCFPVMETCQGESDVKIKSLDAQQSAVTEHPGSLGNIMSQTYAAVFTWIGQNGYVYMAGRPVREVYLKGPLDVPVESDMVTEVEIPVRRA